MTTAPVVLRPQGMPFLTIVALLLTAFFGVQAIIVSGAMTTLSLLIALVFLAGAAWFLFQASRSSVVIDRDQFVIKDGSRQRTYERKDIDSVDLSSLSGHVKMNDGTSVTLPLDGRPLIQAGMLLSPPRR